MSKDNCWAPTFVRRGNARFWLNLVGWCVDLGVCFMHNIQLEPFSSFFLSILSFYRILFTSLRDGTESYTIIAVLLLGQVYNDDQCFYSLQGFSRRQLIIDQICLLFWLPVQLMSQSGHTSCYSCIYCFGQVWKCDCCSWSYSWNLVCLNASDSHCHDI